MRIIIFALVTVLAYFTESNYLSAKLKKRTKYDLVICALFHNEEFYIKEWIEFHKLMGVQHFYLYDNGSTDKTIEILQPYIKAKLVNVYSWPIETTDQADNLHNLQLPIYRNAIELVKRKTKWAAFIDLDEFLFPVQEDNLISLLQKYDKYAGLVANWQTYGTSNIDYLNDNELIIETLVWKMPTYADRNKYIKSIVQPNKVSQVTDPHSFHYLPGYYAVNSNGQAAHPGCGKHDVIVIDTIRINHYWFGTRSWFLTNKVPLKVKWGWFPNPTPKKYLDDLMEEYNVEKDEVLSRFIPALRQAMSTQNTGK